MSFFCKTTPGQRICPEAIKINQSSQKHVLERCVKINDRNVDSCFKITCSFFKTESNKEETTYIPIIDLKIDGVEIIFST